ncbi:MAG: hypothetical protein JSV99_10530 [Planctomycetota bacterium]|nr:MAG: hypothetical protein JSV99_10530 [Planctomycetota bacterium]
MEDLLAGPAVEVKSWNLIADFANVTQTAGKEVKQKSDRIKKAFVKGGTEFVCFTGF